MGYLPADRIQAVYTAAITTGLAGQDHALVAGLPAAYVATLPSSGAPAVRLLQTLHALNDVPVLVDGTVPLAAWLRNAVALTSALPEARVFKEALEGIGQRFAPQRSDDAAFVLETEITRNIEKCEREGSAFSAWDLTNILRYEHRGVDIRHDRVRTITHLLMRPLVAAQRFAVRNVGHGAAAHLEYVPRRAQATAQAPAGAGMDAPVATQIAPAMPTSAARSGQEFRVRILHLSDAHFRSDKGALPAARVAQVQREAWKRYRVLGNGFREEIKQVAHAASPDIVCFTGDVADWGLPQEYDEATPFFEDLAADAGVPFDRLFVIPGNHDITRQTNEAAWKRLREVARSVPPRSLSEWVAGGGPPFGVDTALRSEVIERQRNYRDWLTHLKRRELLPESSPHGLVGYRVPLTLPGRPFPIQVVGLDSAWLAGDDNDDGKLLLTEDQIGRLSTDARGRSLDGFRLALVHHPLAHLADGADARRLLADHVDLVLRGHQHDPLADVWSDPDRGLVELAAGCLYEGSEGHRYPNSYTVVEVITDERGRPLRYELLFRSWSARGHWHNDGSLYRSAANGELTIPARGGGAAAEAPASTTHASTDTATPPPPAAAGGVSIGGSVSGTVIVVGSGNSVNVGTKPEK